MKFSEAHAQALLGREIQRKNGAWRKWDAKKNSYIRVCDGKELPILSVDDALAEWFTNGESVSGVLPLQGDTIAVDFDGTCVHHKYPKVGEDVPHAVPVLQELVRRGAQLILWTMRSGDTLDDAVEWFASRDIPLHGIQRNPTQDRWTSSPKAYAQLYIDDAAFGCPLLGDHPRRMVVDWEAVAQHFGIYVKEE